MTWNINLRELLRVNKSVKIDRHLELKDVSRSRQEILRAEPVQVKLEASAKKGIVQVQGECSTVLEVQCSRCLEPFQSELRFPMLEQFRLQERGDEALEDEDIQVVDNDQIDLHPYIEQAFWLALPYVHVCREDCQGLCQVCGTNRNEHDCGCSQDRIDPRLAALEDFFKKN